MTFQVNIGTIIAIAMFNMIVVTELCTNILQRRHANTVQNIRKKERSKLHFIIKELNVNQVRSNYAQMPFRQARACKTSEAHLMLRGREFCLVKSGKAQVMNILQRIANTIVSTTLLVTY